MSYQNVGVPRFYIDLPNYLRSIGVAYTEGLYDTNIPPSGEYTQFFSSFFGLKDYNNPTFTTQEEGVGLNIQFETDNNIDSFVNDNNFYVAILNHNFDGSHPIQLKTDASLSTNAGQFEGISEIINCFAGSFAVYCLNKGISIITTNTTDLDKNILKFLFDAKVGLYIGGISFGSYYDMPVSPDLDLSMTTEFDGYDTTTTLGGSTLTNVRYTGAPWWRDSEGNKIEPWSVGESNGVSKRNGRRVWSMKFSYLSDKDIFSSNYMSNTYIQDGDDSLNDDYNTNGDLNTARNAFEYTLENDDSFVAQVLNKVGNGQRFIFQPNNNSNSPSDFAICQLDQDSLQIKQVAFKTYSISLRIREVW